MRKAMIRTRKNRKNDQWLSKSHEEVSTVMYTKFPASVMVLGGREQ